MYTFIDTLVCYILGYIRLFNVRNIIYRRLKPTGIRKQTFNRLDFKSSFPGLIVFCKCTDCIFFFCLIIMTIIIKYVLNDTLDTSLKKTDDMALIYTDVMIDWNRQLFCSSKFLFKRHNNCLLFILSDYYVVTM